jgi:DNA-binding NarL/FixJ family response regulator
MPSLAKRSIAERPQVAVVDWAMATQDLAATARLLSELDSPSVVFLTVSENSKQKQEMLRLGAKAFVSKWCSARTLQKAVLQARTDNAPPRAAAPKPAAPPSGGSGPQALQQLTRRERQLLPLVCSGLRNKEIASQLGIAETTVWHHLTAIFTKLQVEDRMALVAFVYRSGLAAPRPAEAPGEVHQAQFRKYPPHAVSVDARSEANALGGTGGSIPFDYKHRQPVFPW